MTWLPTDDTPLTEAAVLYAAHGFRVVTLWWIVNGVCACKRPDCGKSSGKHPIQNAWQKHASSDVDAIKDVRRGKPLANVGLAMGGPDRLVAVDVDGEAGRASWAELEAMGDIPVTLTSKSGREDGGEHRIFRVPAHLDIKRLGNRSGMRKPGIDTRTDNGQVVVAPSVHLSGMRYTWTVRAPVAELPEWLFEQLAKPIEVRKPVSSPPVGGYTNVHDFRKPYIDKAIENAARDIAACAEGQRNEKLWAKSCTIFEYHIGEGLDHQPAWRALYDAGLSCGLPAAEVERTLAKAWRHAPNNPRRVPQRTAGTYNGGRAEYVDDDTVRVAHDGDGVILEDEPKTDTSWKRLLDLNSDGFPRKTLGNVATILSQDPRWRGVLAWDAFGECVVKLKPAPCREQDTPRVHGPGEWSDEDTTRTVSWISSVYGLDVSNASHVDQAVATVALGRVVHPIRDYLDGLTWDGEPRLDCVLTDFFGARDSRYTRLVGARWMISAVARIFRPGCQADCMLVLESERQGEGKSTGLQILAGADWFSDTGINVGDKDSYQGLRRKWIVEFGELSAIKGREVERVKNFVSARSDNYRPSYGRRNRDFPRQCVFAGTTNESQYLADRTGNRRFWPVRVEGVIDRDGLAEVRDQLWAEAVARFRRGDAWHVDTPEFRALCEEEQAERVTGDPWEQLVAQWLENPWVTRHDPADGGIQRERLDIDDGVTTADVLVSALRLRTGEITRASEMRCGEVLRALGYRRTRMRVEGGRAYRFIKVGTVGTR